MWTNAIAFHGHHCDVIYISIFQLHIKSISKSCKVAFDLDVTLSGWYTISMSYVWGFWNLTPNHLISRSMPSTVAHSALLDQFDDIAFTDWIQNLAHLLLPCITFFIRSFVTKREKKTHTFFKLTKTTPCKVLRSTTECYLCNDVNTIWLLQSFHSNLKYDLRHWH